eukprot:CAMPEP_0181029912 /NCGR_PEP_ID=MMETSP1070-20121207/5448_1 /TAXON_ID=265543 /ORGANISM="Minutocellus polymorphus, Strain NH13" /LENGTH=442 /DNA_ID=CAMNT_0023107247 /DNA_START=37 /DNA_END=1365 /DNA_ORIENTATION=+
MKTPASSLDETDLFEGYDLVNIFKFCALQDVLSFCTTSKRAISDVAVELDRRRRRRMMCPTRWEYAPDGSGARVLGVDGKEADWSAHKYRFFSLGLKCPTNEDVLPSVTDRLGVLLRSRSFVASHPLYIRVRELYYLLNENIIGDCNMTDENQENEGAMKELSDDVPFENLLMKLRRASRAHRLHAEILMDAIQPQLNNDEANFASAKVSLERYIGEVQVAYFFISHTVSGLVEGGPSEENWMDATLKNISSRTESATPYSWYKAWIFLHSTVLRTAPFLPEHSKLLGIEPRMLMPGISADDGLSLPRAELIEDNLGLPPLIPPPPPFVGADKRIMMSRMSQFNDEMPMKITKYGFGGLGPAFRGRDNVSSETIWPMRAISVITAFTGLAAAHYQSPTSPAALRWREGTEPGIRWLLDTHAESSKSRPMTVLPPFISITAKR